MGVPLKVAEVRANKEKAGDVLCTMHSGCNGYSTGIKQLSRTDESSLCIWIQGHMISWCCFVLTRCSTLWLTFASQFLWARLKIISLKHHCDLTIVSLFLGWNFPGQPMCQPSESCLPMVQFFVSLGGHYGINMPTQIHYISWLEQWDQIYSLESFPEA